MSSLHFGRVIGSLGSSLLAPGETSEVQNVLHGNVEAMEMEMGRTDNRVIVPDGATVVI